MKSVLNIMKSLLSLTMLIAPIFSFGQNHKAISVIDFAQIINDKKTEAIYY